MFGNTGLCLLYLFIFEYLDQIHSNKGSSIYYVRKIFRKTNIFYPLIRKSTFPYQGVRLLFFWKILRTR